MQTDRSCERPRSARRRIVAATLLALAACLLATGLWSPPALAHAVTLGDKGYIQEISGVQIIPFLYLGAKHMVTGYDHILFLFGVIFFLYGLKEIGVYVTLFAIGHSTTMLLGGCSISASTATSSTRSSASRSSTRRSTISAPSRPGSACGRTPRSRRCCSALHGFGLASRIIDYEIAPDGLVANLIAFNVGVEIGQLTALTAILVVMTRWRASPSFARQAYAANVLMMTAGFALMGLQITGYFVA